MAGPRLAVPAPSPAGSGTARLERGPRGGTGGRGCGLRKPPVRKLAKDLGVDLAGLAGTGPDGTITRDDVEAAVAAPAAPAAPVGQPQLPAPATVPPGRLPHPGRGRNG